MPNLVPRKKIYLELAQLYEEENKQSLVETLSKLKTIYPKYKKPIMIKMLNKLSSKNYPPYDVVKEISETQNDVIKQNTRNKLPNSQDIEELANYLDYIISEKQYGKAQNLDKDILKPLIITLTLTLYILINTIIR